MREIRSLQMDFSKMGAGPKSPKNNQPNNATNSNNPNNPIQSNNFGFNNRNNSNNSNNQGNNSQPNNDIQTMVNRTLVCTLRNFSSWNAGSQPATIRHSFDGLMVTIKFRSNLAESSRMKVDDAYIDSGATHHFFHQRSIFLNYTKMNEEPVQGAMGITKIIGKGYVKLPTENSIPVEAYHAPMFSANILSVALLSDHYEVVFSKSLNNYSACFFMCKKTFEIVAEYPLRGGLYPFNLPSITRKAYTIYTRSKKLEEWHRKLGHISSERLFRLSKMAEDVPPFDKELRKHFESIPCITAKTKRSVIPSSTRRTTRPLELVHLDISEKVEESLHA